MHYKSTAQLFRSSTGDKETRVSCEICLDNQGISVRLQSGRNSSGRELVLDGD